MDVPVVVGRVVSGSWWLKKEERKRGAEKKRKIEKENGERVHGGDLVGAGKGVTCRLLDGGSWDRERSEPKGEKQRKGFPSRCRSGSGRASSAIARRCLCIRWPLDAAKGNPFYWRSFHGNRASS